MNKKYLLIQDAFNKSWQSFKNNASLLVIIFAVYIIINFLFGLTKDFFTFSSSIIGLNLLGGILNLFIGFIIMKIGLDITNHQKTNLIEFAKKGELFLFYFLAHCLYFLIVLFGFVLLVVPGVIWAMQFAFSPILVIDRNLRPIDALKASSQLTKGYRWQLFVFFLISILINFVGVLLFGLGLFLSLPISLLAYIYVYQYLKQESQI